MAIVILPDHSIFRHPHVVSNPYAPVFMADGGFSRQQGEDMLITFYEISPPGAGIPAVFVSMRREAFDRSMFISASQFLPGVARRLTRH